MASVFTRHRSRLLALKSLRGRKETQAGRDACPSCARAVDTAALEENRGVCPFCGFHFPLTARDRLRQLMDGGVFREHDAALVSDDPLDFPGYEDKLASLRADTGLADALVCATGRIGGAAVAVGVLDSRFLMGSMGAVVGEKLVRLIERATRRKLPLIVFSASGGARMQEGVISLMQMAKTAAALERFSAAGGLFISVATHPTTGGVTASFASLGDIQLAEPGALVGFAGPRVVEQTIGEKLPEGFQSAEFLLEHGFLDAVVPRARMRATMIQLLTLHARGGAERVR